jgi:hypothetical protein
MKGFLIGFFFAALLIFFVDVINRWALTLRDIAYRKEHDE